MKKKFKEFIPLWDFVKEKKTKIIISSILIFIVELVGLLYGYLNGKAVEEVLEQMISDNIIKNENDRETYRSRFLYL